MLMGSNQLTFCIFGANTTVSIPAAVVLGAGKSCTGLISNSIRKKQFTKRHGYRRAYTFCRAVRAYILVTFSGCPVGCNPFSRWGFPNFGKVRTRWGFVGNLETRCKDWTQSTQTGTKSAPVGGCFLCTLQGGFVRCSGCPVLPSKSPVFGFYCVLCVIPLQHPKTAQIQPFSVLEHNRKKQNRIRLQTYLH